MLRLFILRRRLFIMRRLRRQQFMRRRRLSIMSNQRRLRIMPQRPRAVSVGGFITIMAVV